jgi:transposase-like protein
LLFFFVYNVPYLSVPALSLHTEVFQKRKKSMKNEGPNKGKGGREWNHSESFRVQVALEYLDGDQSYPQIERKYGLTTSTARRFVSWYKRTQDQLMLETVNEAEERPLSSGERKDLEKRLALSELKVAVLEKVIAIANAEYGTDLKKKAATK